MKAMEEVPREAFVPGSMTHFAFENGPLPIGFGQTISQPYIVALMTEALDPQPTDKVLEIGTGSGYQAAVLAEVGCRVWSMEVVEELGAKATRALQESGYADSVVTRVGDAYYGWEEEAPFDAIVVTAATPEAAGQRRWRPGCLRPTGRRPRYPRPRRPSGPARHRHRH